MFFINLFPTHSVYAMEHINIWKNGIYYTSGQFDLKLLKYFIFNSCNIEITHNNLKDILIKNQLQGLFYKPHIFFIYNNFEVLSSLTHFENNKCIFISDYDYQEKNNTQNVGEPFDYIQNKIFFKAYSNIVHKDQLMKYLSINSNNMLSAFKKQSLVKPTDIAKLVLDDLNLNDNKNIKKQ